MKLSGAVIVIVKSLYTEYLIRKANKFQNKVDSMVVVKR